ncbi:MAG: MFS transporter, partial [Anaerolineae bacterium]
RTAMLADLYGGDSYGRISAVQVTMMRVANMLAPVGAGLIYTANGNSYRLVLPILVGLAFLAALAVLKVDSNN